MRSSYRPKRYQEIDFYPPVKVQEQAIKWLKLRSEHSSDAATWVWLSRARDLKHWKQLTPKTIDRMVNYFARHEIDKEAEKFWNENDPSNWYISRLLWWWDPGKKRSENVQKQMTKADKNK